MSQVTRYEGELPVHGSLTPSSKEIITCFGRTENKLYSPVAIKQLRCISAILCKLFHQHESTIVVRSKNKF